MGLSVGLGRSPETISPVATGEGTEVAEPPKPLTRSYSGRVMFFELLSDSLRGNLIFMRPVIVAPDRML